MIHCISTVTVVLIRAFKKKYYSCFQEKQCPEFLHQKCHLVVVVVPWKKLQEVRWKRSSCTRHVGIH
jgi:hypothetical protein